MERAVEQNRIDFVKGVVAEPKGLVWAHEGKITYDKQVLGYWFRSPLAYNLLQELKSSTLTLLSNLPIKKITTSRGSGMTLHLAFWRKSSSISYRSKDFRNPWAQWWATKNYEVWNFLSDLLGRMYPTVKREMQKVRLPFTFGVWTALSLNYNFSVGSHIDDRDMKDGICCVVILGDFKGGEFCFANPV